MRATLWMIAGLLAVLALLAWAGDWLCRDSAATFGREAEQMQALLRQGDWPQLQRALDGVAHRWEAREWVLQMLIRHQETDDVAETLNKLQAGVTAQDESLCLWALAEFAESSRHLHHRDALSLTNIF